MVVFLSKLLQEDPKLPLILGLVDSVFEELEKQSPESDFDIVLVKSTSGSDHLRVMLESVVYDQDLAYFAILCWSTPWYQSLKA